MRIVLSPINEDLKAIGMPPLPVPTRRPPAAPAAAQPAAPPVAAPPEEEGLDMGMDGEDPMAPLPGDEDGGAPLPMPPEDEAAPPAAAPPHQCSCPQGGGQPPMESVRRRAAAPARRPQRRQESALERRSANLLEQVRNTLGEIRGTHLDEAQRGFRLVANNAFYVAKGLDRVASAYRSPQVHETAQAMRRLSNNAVRYYEALQARTITVKECEEPFKRYFGAVVEGASLYDRLVEDDEEGGNGDTANHQNADDDGKMNAFNKRSKVKPGENLDQPTEGDDSDLDDEDPDAELEDVGEMPPFNDDDDDDEPAEESRKGRSFRGKRR